MLALVRNVIIRSMLDLEHMFKRAFFDLGTSLKNDAVLPQFVDALWKAEHLGVSLRRKWIDVQTSEADRLDVRAFGRSSWTATSVSIRNIRDFHGAAGSTIVEGIGSAKLSKVRNPGSAQSFSDEHRSSARGYVLIKLGAQR